MKSSSTWMFWYKPIDDLTGLPAVYAESDMNSLVGDEGQSTKGKWGVLTTNPKGLRSGVNNVVSVNLSNTFTQTHTNSPSPNQCPAFDEYNLGFSIPLDNPFELQDGICHLMASIIGTFVQLTAEKFMTCRKFDPNELMKEIIESHGKNFGIENLTPYFEKIKDFEQALFENLEKNFFREYGFAAFSHGKVQREISQIKDCFTYKEGVISPIW